MRTLDVLPSLLAAMDALQNEASPPPSLAQTRPAEFDAEWVRELTEDLEQRLAYGDASVADIPQDNAATLQ